MMQAEQVTTTVSDVLAAVSTMGGLVRRTSAGTELWFREPPTEVIEQTPDFYEKRNALRQPFRAVQQLICDHDLAEQDWDTCEAWNADCS